MYLIVTTNNIILKGQDKGDGFWSCEYSDLVHYEGSRKPSYITNNNATVNAFPTMIQHAVKHFSAEERSRAAEAFALCPKLGHPSDIYLSNSLNNGNFSSCHLTSQDLKNARDLFGPCLACLEGKI